MCWYYGAFRSSLQARGGLSPKPFFALWSQTSQPPDCTQTDGEARISSQALLVTVSGGTESWEQSDARHCHPRLIVQDRQQSPRMPSYWPPNEVRDFGAEQGKIYDHKVAVAHKEFSLEAVWTGLHVRRVLAA